MADDDDVGRGSGADAAQLIVGQTFGGDIESPEHVKDVFLRHLEAVQRGLPPKRLLVYEVKDGWQPLCGFFLDCRCRRLRSRTSTRPMSSARAFRRERATGSLRERALPRYGCRLVRPSLSRSCTALLRGCRLTLLSDAGGRGGNGSKKSSVLAGCSRLRAAFGLARRGTFT